MLVTIMVFLMKKIRLNYRFLRLNQLLAIAQNEIMYMLSLLVVNYNTKTCFVLKWIFTRKTIAVIYKT